MTDKTGGAPPGTLIKGDTQASYFWDDGSGVNGDTGTPAGGEGMQEGLFASPCWPLGTTGYVMYNGKKADFFVGDRGPGSPSNDGVMLDMDGKTYAKLTGGTWNSDSKQVDGFGPGRIEVTYVITKWGSGTGLKDFPQPFSSGAWREWDSRPNTAPIPKAVVPARASRDSDRSVKPAPVTKTPATTKHVAAHRQVDTTTAGVAPVKVLAEHPIAAPAGLLSAMVGVGVAVAYVKKTKMIADEPGGRHRLGGKARRGGRHRRRLELALTPAFAPAI